MTQGFVQDCVSCWRGLSSFPRTQHAVRFFREFFVYMVKIFYFCLVEFQDTGKVFPRCPKLRWQPFQMILINFAISFFFKKEKSQKNCINKNRKTTYFLFPLWRTAIHERPCPWLSYLTSSIVYKSDGQTRSPAQPKPISISSLSIPLVFKTSF